jgi:hypothetical protein
MTRGRTSVRGAPAPPKKIAHYHRIGGHEHSFGTVAVCKAERCCQDCRLAASATTCQPRTRCVGQAGAADKSIQRESLAPKCANSFRLRNDTKRRHGMFCPGRGSSRHRSYPYSRDWRIAHRRRSRPRHTPRIHASSSARNAGTC